MDEWMDSYTDAKAVEGEQKHLAEMLIVQEKAKAKKPVNQPLLAYLAKQIADQRETIRLMTNTLAQQVAAYNACLSGVQA